MSNQELGLAQINARIVTPVGKDWLRIASLNTASPSGTLVRLRDRFRNQDTTVEAANLAGTGFIGVGTSIDTDIKGTKRTIRQHTTNSGSSISHEVASDGRTIFEASMGPEGLKIQGREPEENDEIGYTVDGPNGQERKLFNQESPGNLFIFGCETGQPAYTNMLSTRLNNLHLHHVNTLSALGDPSFLLDLKHTADAHQITGGVSRQLKKDDASTVVSATLLPDAHNLSFYFSRVETGKAISSLKHSLQADLTSWGLDLYVQLTTYNFDSGVMGSRMISFSGSSCNCLFCNLKGGDISGMDSSQLLNQLVEEQSLGEEKPPEEERPLWPFEDNQGDILGIIAAVNEGHPFPKLFLQYQENFAQVPPRVVVHKCRLDQLGTLSKSQRTFLCLSRDVGSWVDTGNNQTKDIVGEYSLKVSPKVKIDASPQLGQVTITQEGHGSFCIRQDNGTLEITIYDSRPFAQALVPYSWFLSPVKAECFTEFPGHRETILLEAQRA